MTIKQKKTAKELEQLALEIVRRMQGCSHVEAVTVSSNPDKGWFISSCTPTHANSSDVRRAILIAEADLIDRFDLTWDNKTGQTGFEMPAPSITQSLSPSITRCVSSASRRDAGAVSK